MNATDTQFSVSTVRTHTMADQVRTEYGSLRRLAARKMAWERASHLLTATALVNEVTVRLLSDNQSAPESRDQFFAYAGRAMHNLLVDHARAEGTQKRGGGQSFQVYDENLVPTEAQTDQVAVLREALGRLRRIDARRASVVELRFYQNLSNQEIAERLDVSLATVKRDREGARAWLQMQVGRDAA